MNFIDDPRKWRISKSGFTIRTGWADEKKLIAAYPYATSPLDAGKFQEWLENAEKICQLYNASFTSATETITAVSASQPTGAGEMEVES